jgi:hypothetical protein
VIQYYNDTRIITRIIVFDSAQLFGLLRDRDLAVDGDVVD